MPTQDEEQQPTHHIKRLFDYNAEFRKRLRQCWLTKHRKRLKTACKVLKLKWFSYGCMRFKWKFQIHLAGHQKEFEALVKEVEESDPFRVPARDNKGHVVVQETAPEDSH